MMWSLVWAVVLSVVALPYIVHCDPAHCTNGAWDPATEDGLDCGGDCSFLCPSNYKSGIDLLLGGSPAVDFVEEYLFHDRPFDDHKVIYIKSGTSLSFQHNARNVITGNLMASLCSDHPQYQNPSTVIGVNGWDTLPDSGDEGDIVFRVDRDTLNQEYHVVDGWLDRQYTIGSVFSFGSLQYTAGVNVVGTTGPDADGHFGVLDSFGNEWHTITYWDDDISFGCMMNGQSRYSDGKIATFVVDPKTPALVLKSTGANGQFYTTPAKKYWIPRIMEQISYVSGGVLIHLVNIMNANPVYYTIDGGAQQLYENPISTDTLSQGEHILEYWYDVSQKATRKIVKDPPYPSANEYHGKLLFKDEARLEYVKDKITSEMFGNALQNWIGSVTSGFSSRDTFPTEYRRTWRAGMGQSSSVLKYMLYYILADVDVADEPEYAAYVKSVLLDSFTIDYIGHEIPLWKPVPSRDVLSLGQEQIDDCYGPLTYDLLIGLFKSPDHVDGVTAIEDLKIRDNFAMKAHSVMQFKDNNGYQYNAGSGDIHWGLGMEMVMTFIAMAMPQYDTHYYGTSGADQVTLPTHLWAPFPQQNVSWWQVITNDPNVPLLGQHVSRYNLIYDNFADAFDLPQGEVYWTGPNAFHCCNTFLPDPSAVTSLETGQCLLRPEGAVCSQYAGATTIATISGNVCAPSWDRTHGPSNCNGAQRALFHVELSGYESPFTEQITNLNAIFRLNYNAPLSSNVEGYLDTKVRRIAGTYPAAYMQQGSNNQGSIYGNFPLSLYSEFLPAGLSALPYVLTQLAPAKLQNVFAFFFFETNPARYIPLHCLDGQQNEDEEGVDCGGSCAQDIDADGFFGRLCDLSAPTADCDDTNAQANPSMTEICTPKLEFDDDCNGFKYPDFYVDGDFDGVNTCQDNCPAHCNPAQDDTDYDGIGDVCDEEFILFEDFEQQTDYTVKASPNGFSFTKVMGSVFLGQSTTHWDWDGEPYSSRMFKMSGGNSHMIVTNEGRSEWGNYTVTALIGQKYMSDGGFVLHFQDNQTYYLVNLRGSTITKVENGTASQLLGEGGAISLAAAGNSAVFTVTSVLGPDGQLNISVYNQVTETTRVFTDTNPHTTYGSVGFYSTGGTSGNYWVFDDLEIQFVNPYGVQQPFPCDPPIPFYPEGGPTTTTTSTATDSVDPVEDSAAAIPMCWLLLALLVVLGM